MTAASANKVTVPGDNRLDELKLGNKTPFWHKIPIIKELRVAVGWQKGMLITGLVLTAFFLLVAIFAPLIAPYSYAQLKGADGVSFPAQAAPSSEHIWGTTAGGYDVFSRVVWGARTAVIAIVVAVLLSIFAGVLLGLVSGYFGGWVDRVLVMIADAVYSFPSLLLAILMAIMISHGQSGLWSGIFASGISITVVYIPQYFRTIRAEVIRIKESAYVESARVVGASTATGFSYDADSGLYRMLHADGTPQLDANNGQQAGFDNLLVLFSASELRDDGKTYDYDLSMGGGVWLNGGHLWTITWTQGRDNTLLLYDADGRTMNIEAGTSYIALVTSLTGQELTVTNSSGEEILG